MNYALITGASSGLGAETARQLASRVDYLILVARREDRLQALAQSLACPCHLIVADLETDSGIQQVHEAVTQASQKGDSLDWAILAAGWGRMGALTPETEAAACSMLNLNVVALTRLTARLQPALKRNLILYASVAAFLPQPYFAVYAASKAYVFSLARAFRAENPHLHVVAVCPNPVDTEFFNHTGEQASKLKQLGLERPEHVVKKALAAVEKNRPVSLSHPLAHLIRVLAKVVPIRWALWIERRIGLY